MSEAENTPFVPVLTVMVDYGFAPFLWLVERPDQGGIGGMLCESSCWEDDYPMSEALWRKFAIWAKTFERISFYGGSGEDAECWDWPAFHARGLQLARELKAEVGDAYRVVYEKPAEDPNDRLDGRREILADGTLLALPPLPGSREPLRFCERIISGGQTGADRAALDFAIEYGYPHGGWTPRGREAEDGCIALKYQLTELPEGGYRQRTRRNVEDSDGTLIVNMDELDGGTLATKNFAEKAGKPYYIAQFDDGATDEIAADILAWLRAHDIKTLNVAGPRESKRPGIYQLTTALLEAVENALFEDVP